VDDGTAAGARRGSSGSPFEATIGFSRAVRVGDRVIVSGTAPVWPDGDCPEDPAVQARRCFEIIALAIEEAGGRLGDVVRTRMLLVSAADAEAVGAVHHEVFGDVRPAATMVVVAALLDPRWRRRVASPTVGGSGSVSFDRAAGFYDATRGLPHDVSAELAGILAAELAGRGPCLEIGVGTGRIALPLAERGVALVGVDIAPAMLARLVQNAGGHSPLGLAVADATRLPIASGSVGAVIASHVFHLVTAWREAADEAARVLRAGGVLLVDFGGGAPAPWGITCEELAGRHGVSAIRPGTSSPDELGMYLGDSYSRRPLSAVPMTVTRTLAGDLDEWERQIHAWTWSYPAEQMARACDEIRRWAQASGMPLDEPVEVRRLIQWWGYVCS
jgi:SAM-dependent methyltransferase